MHVSRRGFLVGGAVLATASRAGSDGPMSKTISPATIAEAQKLAALEFDEKERALIAKAAPAAADGYRKRRKTPLENGLGPATVFDPRLPGETGPSESRPFVRSKTDPGPLPAKDEDIAFAPVWALSRWIERGKLTSERLTRIYLERLGR